MPFVKHIPPAKHKKTKWEIKPCYNPEHNPPTHIVLQPGIHVYKCPGCGKETVINVPEISWQSV